MNGRTYKAIEDYMQLQMGDAAHDCQHIYRVLYQALKIAQSHPEVDKDILIAACLLHDVGRQAQFNDPSLCHALEGSKMAYVFLKELGWEESRCRHAADCVATHRFRREDPPKTIEAKILFDADKLDVTGALGIARSLIYQGEMNVPLYRVKTDGRVCDGSSPDAQGSFFKEYHYKLSKLYDRFFTEEAAQIAGERKAILEDFRNALLQEISLAGFSDLLELN